MVARQPQPSLQEIASPKPGAAVPREGKTENMLCTVEGSLEYMHTSMGIIGRITPTIPTMGNIMSSSPPPLPSHYPLPASCGEHRYLSV